MSRMQWQRRWDPFRDFQREVGRLFESLEPLHWRVVRQFPAINLYDAGNHYVLTAQLPGVAPEDLDLSITGETLTLRGERKRPRGSPKRVIGGRNGRSRWTRIVTLPDRVDGSQVAASFAHGILTVTCRRRRAPGRGKSPCRPRADARL